MSREPGPDSDADRGSPRRRRWAPRTLRGRLTAGLVLVLVLACAVIGVATALFLRGFLVTRLDKQLASAGGRFSTSLEHGSFSPGGSDGDSDNAIPGQSVGTLGVRLKAGVVTDAAVVEPSGDNRRLRLSASDTRTLATIPAGGGPRSVHLGALGDYRAQAVAGRDGDVQITGLPFEAVDETVARLAVIEVILFSAVVLASGALTALVVRRSLRSLRDLGETALHVSELPLTDAATPLPGSIAPPDPSSEVDQVSVAFDHMLEHIRNALAARDHTEASLRRFVADASHELRTPLATIRAYSEFATRSGEVLPETAAVALSRIDVAAGRMATLVDDLLLLARLDSGRPLARETVDLTQLLVEAVDDARTATPDHRWHLDLPDEPVEVTGDAERLHQVVVNLLSNARNHTPAGTTVTAALTERPQAVEIDVSDDGPGIPADLREDLFDRFTRGDVSRSARAADSSSTGLGLAIAHGIVAAHAGTLDVESEPGSTTFRVCLPTGTEPPRTGRLGERNDESFDEQIDERHVSATSARALKPL